MICDHRIKCYFSERGPINVKQFLFYFSKKPVTFLTTNMKKTMQFGTTTCVFPKKKKKNAFLQIH